MVTLILAALLGCAPPTPAEILIDGVVDAHGTPDADFPSSRAAVPAAFTLTLELRTDLRSGHVTGLRVTGAQPGDRVRVGYSLDGAVSGAGPCPPGLGGTCLDLVTPVLIATQRATVNGGVSVRADIGVGEDTEVCFQAGVAAGPRGASTPALSNVVCATVQPRWGVAPEPGWSQDIWTTSVYAYDPVGGGPGGGLDNEILRVGGWGDHYESLIKIPVEAMPPWVASAAIRLWSIPPGGAGQTNVIVDRITSSWDWKTTGSGRDRLRLWWSDHPSTTAYGGSQAPAAPGSWQSIDVTTAYHNWHAGSWVNQGILLRPVSNWNNYTVYASSETPLGAAYRPRLVVTPFAFDGHDYWPATLVLSAAEAHAFCALRGMRLLTVDSEAERGFLVGMYAGKGFTTVWDAITDRVSEGTWRDLDYNPPGWEGWAAGQPDDAGDADCAVQDAATGELSDVSCAEVHGVVCESG